MLTTNLVNISTLVDRYFVKQPRLRRLVTALLERDRNSVIDIAGARLQVNNRLEHGYLRASRMVLKNGTLRDEMPVLMNLFAVLRDGDTFVDIGANVGLYAHAVVRLRSLYKSLQVVAIEANPDTFARLSATPVDGIRYLNFAASDTSGILTFVGGAVSHVFTTVDKKNSYNIPTETVDVPSRRLDELEFPSNSLVVKIDVEGQEARVLEGAKELFEQQRVRAVYLDGYDDDTAVNFLVGYGFDLFDGRTLHPVTGKVFSLLALKRS